MIEREEKNNFTNKKKRNMPLLASRLINYTGNKRDPKAVNNIPKCNINIPKKSKIESSRESIDVKNLNNIFQQSIEKSVEKNRNLSNLDEVKLKNIHKAISSNDIRKKNFNNCLYTDYIKNNNKNINRINEFINKNKNSPSPINLKNNNIKNEGNIFQNKNQDEEKIDIVSRIKRYNNSLEKEEKSELIRVIRNIRQYKDIKSINQKMMLPRIFSKKKWIK